MNPELLAKYNVLGSWYSMPERLFGYKSKVIEKRFYDLIKAGCKIQKTLNFRKKFN